MKGDDYPKIAFETPNDFEEFLEKEHKLTPGVWIKVPKKGSGMKAIGCNELLEVALCYGWIDGQAGSFDEKCYLVKFTPRGPRSIWSKRNVDIVAKLIKEGRMRASGLEKIEEAIKDGRWEAAYAGLKDAVIPEDFLNELKKDEMAYEFYQTLNKSNLYAIYFRLVTAKKPETREKRMKVILEMMQKGEKLH